MKIRLSALFPLIIVSLVPGPRAVAQTDNSIPEVTCNEISERPTLKLRGSLPNTSNSPTRAQSPQKEPGGLAQSSESQVKVQFEGLHTFASSDVLKSLRERRVNLQKARTPSAKDLAKATAVVNSLLEERGYMHAVVAAFGDEEAKIITFLVNEGPRSSISEIRFEGNRVFSSQELAARIQDYLGAHKLDGHYDADVFEIAVRNMTNFIRSRGYLQARAGKQRVEITEQGLAVTIPVEEGECSTV